MYSPLKEPVASTDVTFISEPRWFFQEELSGNVAAAANVTPMINAKSVIEATRNMMDPQGEQRDDLMCTPMWRS
jgi:hypothetical protein